jgi:hypothetical protein
MMVCRPSLRGPDEVLFALRTLQSINQSFCRRRYLDHWQYRQGIGIRECDTYMIHTNAYIDSIG